jgi:hypothetical protein
VDRSTLERIAQNEGLFREVNEAIERGLWPGEEDTAPFRCECAALECNAVVTLDVHEYERIRQHPRRFFVLEGHEVPDAEEVVQRGTGWVVVEKRGQAGVVAESIDPRS